MRRSRFDHSFAVTLLGFSLFLSWPYCAFLMTSLLMSSAHDKALNEYCWIVSLFFVSLTLFCLSVAGRHALKLVYRTGVRAACVLLHAAANGAIVVGGTVPGMSGIAIVLVSSAVTGLATGFLHVQWGMRVAAIGVGKTPSLVPLAYACSFAGVLSVSLAPVETRAALVFVGILAAGVLLCLPPEEGVKVVQLEDGAFEDTTVSTGGSDSLIRVLSVRDCVVIFFCFVCVSFIDSLNRPLRMVDIADFPATLFFAAIVAAVAAIALMRLSRGATFGSVSRFVTPILSFGLLFSVWQLEPPATVAYVVVFSAMQITVIFIWIAGITHGVRSANGVVRMLGIPLGVHYAGTVVGSAVGLLVGFVDPAMLAFFLAALLCSVVILCNQDTGVQRPIIAREYIDARAASFDRIAARFGLSKRESEIFALFASGRNAAYIRETCFISKNTIDTHLKHIYDKTGVRSKQGLIDLVEKEERILFTQEQETDGVSRGA